MGQYITKSESSEKEPRETERSTDEPNVDADFEKIETARGERMKVVEEKFDFTTKIFFVAFTLNIIAGFAFQVFNYEADQETNLGFFLARSNGVKLKMILFPSILLAIAVASSLYAWLDHDKGWLLAAILFQTAFASSCHLLYDEATHIIFALFTMATSFVVVFCLMRIDQLLDESAKLGNDRRAKKKSSLIDLPDLTTSGLAYITYATSGACIIIACCWLYVFVEISDFEKVDNLTDRFDQFMCVGFLVVLVIIAASGIYGVARNQRVYIILSSSVCLVTFATLAIVSTNVMNLSERMRSICRGLNQGGNELPNWLDMRLFEEYFWSWNELEVTIDQALAGFAATGRTPENLRQLALYDGTGDECDKLVNTRDWIDILIYLSLFFTLAHSWTCFRISEKLQSANVRISTFLGFDLVKDMDSYMDPIQFILFGTAVGVFSLYRILVALDTQDAYKRAICFDPPVPIPALGMYCAQIAAANQCGDLSDARLCPLSCNLPCEDFDLIITSWQMVGQHLIPAITLCVVGVLNYINARDGVEYDKEYSNAIWFLSIWGSGTTIFFGVLNMIQGNQETDWVVYAPMAMGDAWNKIYQTVGLLKVVGGATLLMNVVFANMYAEALEDNPTEEFNEIELSPQTEPSSPGSRIPEAAQSTSGLKLTE